MLFYFHYHQIFQKQGYTPFFKVHIVLLHKLLAECESDNLEKQDQENKIRKRTKIQRDINDYKNQTGL